MYESVTVIPNSEARSLVAEVSFHPSGSFFAVSYSELNQVKLFDTKRLSLIRTYAGSDSRLDHPHGVLLTDHHLIVTNTHHYIKPSTLTVYPLGSDREDPVQVFETPFEHFREGHSMAMRNDILVITYCESLGKTGAVVSYAFDDDAGVISNPLDKSETCFDALGDAKGISFTEDGRKLYVSFTSSKPREPLRLPKRIKNARKILLGQYERKLRQSFASLLGRPNDLNPRRTTANGIAILDISEKGKLSREPSEILFSDGFSRLENVQIHDGVCLVTDTVNGKVHLYDHHLDPELKSPIHTLSDQMTLPHGAKISPDKETIVVTNYGLKVVGQDIEWGTWTEERGDNVLVYRRSSSQASSQA